MRYRNYKRGYNRQSRQYAQQQTVLNTHVEADTAAYTTGTFDLVPATTEQGARTVSHLNIKLLTDYGGSSDTAQIPFGYTIQYVPSGQTAQTPGWNATGDLLAANQYVMACGVWNPCQRILDISTLKRKLYNGDKIVMTITNLDVVATTSDADIRGVITYAIKYN